MKQALTMLAAVSVIAIAGCGGSKELQVGEEQVVEKSISDRPSWTSAVSDEKDGFIYVTGEITNARERGFGMNQANADGVQKLLNTMTNKVESSVSQVLRGANMEEGDIGRFSKFAVGWISDTYRVSGVTTPTTYWEKVMKKTSQGVDYFYNCYAQLKISKADYNRAISGAYDELRKKAQAENNKKAEEAAKQLEDDLKKEKQ